MTDHAVRNYMLIVVEPNTPGGVGCFYFPPNDTEAILRCTKAYPNAKVFAVIASETSRMPYSKGDKLTGYAS
jgi:hypothetical protein